jgi:molybdopterin molybdotransferase
MKGTVYEGRAYNDGMIEVDVAQSLALAHARVLPPEPTAMMSSSLGQVLAEAVVADRDSPPFDKSMMDGYSVRFADLQPGTTFRVVGEVAAGKLATTPVEVGEAYRIFTGAAIPAGADTIVMQERVSVLAGDRITIDDATLVLGKNVLRRGAEMRAGDIVLPPGIMLSAQAFGVMASVGRTSVMAHARPRVTIVATGNELVEPNRTPGPGQIRNSNGPMLAALADRAGALPRYLGISPDDDTALKSFLGEGLEIGNVLLISGGVSVGDYDRVPAVLASLGVSIHFHTVRMKPGKPLLFGTRGDRLVFGLPGNPVSSFVGFELFVKPVLKRLMGFSQPITPTMHKSLAADFVAHHDRPTYHPVVIDGSSVTPLAWFGSADLRAMIRANGLMIIPPGPVQWTAGRTVEVLSLTS